jgi:hypothetical protein
MVPRFNLSYLGAANRKPDRGANPGTGYSRRWQECKERYPIGQSSPSYLIAGASCCSPRISARAAGQLQAPKSSADRALHVDSCADQALQANQDISGRVGSLTSAHRSLSVE